MNITFEYGHMILINLFIFFIIFLAASGPSCGTQGLH